MPTRIDLTNDLVGVVKVSQIYAKQAARRNAVDTLGFNIAEKFTDIEAQVRELLENVDLPHVTFEKRAIDIINRFKSYEITYRTWRFNNGYEDEVREEYKQKRGGKVTEMKVSVPDKPGQTSLKMSRGGAREGAGRKKSGLETRKVSISLAPEWWEAIDQLVEYRKKVNPKDTQADLLRGIIEPVLAAIQSRGIAVNSWAEASKEVHKLLNF